MRFFAFCKCCFSRQKYLAKYSNYSPEDQKNYLDLWKDITYRVGKAAVFIVTIKISFFIKRRKFYFIWIIAYCERLYKNLIWVLISHRGNTVNWM